jgi:hypothetical protein
VDDFEIDREPLRRSDAIQDPLIYEQRVLELVVRFFEEARAVGQIGDVSAALTGAYPNTRLVVTLRDPDREDQFEIWGRAFADLERDVQSDPAHAAGDIYDWVQEL